MTINYFTAFVISVLTCVALVCISGHKKNERVEEHWIHDYSTSRAGGLAILFSFLVSFVFFDIWPNYLDESEPQKTMVVKLVLFICMFFFIVGFIEDVIYRISAMWRLVLTALIALLGVGLIFARVDGYVEPFPLDTFARCILLFISIIFVLSLVHGTNMIDGLNGLASGFSIITLLVLAKLFDGHLSSTFLLLASASAGFVLCNFPKGRIFLGDSGAYFFGGLFGLLFVWALLNESLSTTAALFSVIIYPFTEVIWTALRRYITARKTIFKPDSLHLHSLLHIYLSRHLKTKRSGRDINSITSSFLLAMIGLNGLISSFHFSEFYFHVAQSVIFVLAYIGIYTFLYSENRKYKQGVTNSKSIP